MAVVTSSTSSAQTDTVLVAAPGATKYISVYGVHVSSDGVESVSFGEGPISEVTTVDVGAASGGTFTLSEGVNASGNIDYNANAAAVKSAVEGITGITTVSVTGAGTTANPWVITFTDPLGALAITGDGALLTPSDTLTVTETTAGVDSVAKQLLYVAANSTGGIFLGKRHELFRCAVNYPLTFTSTGTVNTFINVHYEIKDVGKP